MIIEQHVTHSILPSKPIAPQSGAIKEYYRKKDGVNVNKYAQDTAGNEVRIDNVRIDFGAVNPVAPTATSIVEEGDQFIVTSDGTKNGAILREFVFADGIWKQVSDSSDNSKWTKNTVNSSIDLKETSTGAVRTSGTGFIIKDNGSVGVGISNPEAPLSVNGAIHSADSATPQANQIQSYRDVVRYTGNNSTVTGAIKIKLPKMASDTMLNIKIKMYNYDTISGASEIILGFCNHTSGFVNHSCVINGKMKSEVVRLGRSATEDYILLGDVTTAWNYPKVIVSEVMSTYQNTTGWGTGWAVSVLTALSADTFVTPTRFYPSSESSPLLLAVDDRAIAPADTPVKSVEAHFTSYANNNTTPYADALQFRTYIDASGGSDNLLMLKKSGFGMRIWQQAFGVATNYLDFRDVQLVPKNIWVNMGANLITTIEHQYINRTAGTLTLLAPATAGAGKEYWISNRSATAMTITSYVNLAGVATTTIPANTGVLLISSGTQWVQFQ
ncbi:MAG: hypothetical protein E6R13_02600 [Spirochaetes bacterium]|nr:MAG: hypothetical protein E6R13_02600 [Spirochaetota bacterium]